MRNYYLLLCFGLSAVTSTGAAPCTAHTAPLTFYVSTSGHDSNDGTTPVTAFRSIQTGVHCLTAPGDKLLILPGTYTELIRIYNKKGDPAKPIVIEGLSGPDGNPGVTILGSITRLTGSEHTFNFHNGSPAAPNREWVKAGNTDEYVSAHVLPAQTTDWQVHQGGFVDPVNGRHTRLIAYHRVEDFRATNETFEKIIDGCRSVKDPREGPIVAKTADGCTERRPWVYMGPGLWFDKDSGKVHIRLSPTHNGVPGLDDYTGETDPNKVALAITDKNMSVLKIENAHNLQLRNLAVKFSNSSVMITDSSNLSFDVVTVWAGRYGLRAGRTKGLTFSNCIFDGGLPTWLFRGDLKDQYKFVDAGQLVDNYLAKQTMEGLIAMEGVGSVEVRHSEFLNAHDLYLQAADVKFHHNWIHNLNDEALFLDGSTNASGVAHHNVITQALSGISLAGDYVAGPWRVYRNLVDLRLPTAGFRPRNATSDRTHVWRNGAAFKGGSQPEGPYDIFQNTFISAFAAEYQDGQAVYPQASFTHLRNWAAPLRSRSSLNNIFAVVNRTADREAPLAFLLPPLTCAFCPQEPAPTSSLLYTSVNINGDLFYRRGFGTKVFATPIPGDESHYRLFSCTPAENCLDKWRKNTFFLSTEAANPPGYEATSVLMQDPRFLSWQGDSAPADDFRLQLTSPARAAGVLLPSELQGFDGDAPKFGLPDIGAYQTAPGTGLAIKLRVGVNGRKVYPQEGAGK